MQSKWEKTTLGEFVNINPRRSVKKGTITPFVGMPDITENVRDIRVIGEREFSSGMKFQDGDVLFARITPCLENGKTVLVSGLGDGVIAHGSTEFIVLSPKDIEYDAKFIYYLARLPKFREFARSRMEGTSGRQRVDASALASYEFMLPPPDVRKSIGEALSAFDDKIALNGKTNKTLEKIAQRIFKSLFIDFDPVKANAEGVAFNGLSPEIQALFPKEFEESELGMIPKGWQFLPFKNVIDKYIDNRGKTPPIVDEGIPLVEVKHLLENSAFPNLNVEKRVTTETFNNWFRTHVEHKDVLISTVGTIGRTSYVKNTDFGIAQNVLGLRFGKIAEPAYMFYTIKAKRFQDDMNARLVTTVQPSIKRKDLDTISILIPPPSIQQAFCSVIEPLLDAQYSRNNENILLTRIRDKLLPKLLSGQILLSDVNQELKETD